MKTKWMLLLIVAILTINGRVLADSTGDQAKRLAYSVSQQQATPQPEEIPSDEVSTPRPPSEAGQNMVLIIGAAMLVLIVFFGVALHTRSSRPHAPQANIDRPPS